MLALATEPVLRRNRRSNRSSRPTTTPTASTATSATAAASHASTNSSTTSPVTALPHAIPCHNYFELFPEEVGAVGNVEITNSEEVRQWQLVGRRVSQAVAEAEGGCVKVTVEGMKTPLYYNITASDDEVYGRAAYLPRSSSSPSVADMVKEEEPFAFLEHSCDACTTEGDESVETSACNSPCGSCASVRCIFPKSHVSQ